MSSKINLSIGRQSYELVRDRIGEILIEELTNQVATYNNQYARADVTVEGNKVSDYTEMSTVFVSLASDEFSNEHTGCSTGDVVYFIDCICRAKNTDTAEGSYLSSFKAQALAGIVRYILKDPAYNTLGYTPPFISRVTVESIKVGDASKNDLESTTGARVTVRVTVNENNAMPTPTLINSYTTSVTLGSTNTGYTYNTQSPV